VDAENDQTEAALLQTEGLGNRQNLLELMSVVEGIKTALERELRGLEKTEGQSASAYDKIKVSKEAVIKTVAARLTDYKFQLANARS